MGKVVTIEHKDIEYIKFTTHMMYINDDAELYMPFNKKNHVLRGDIISKLKRVMFGLSVEDEFIMDYCSNSSFNWYTIFHRVYSNVEIKFKSGPIFKDTSDMPLVATDMLMNLIGNLTNKNK